MSKKKKAAVAIGVLALIGIGLWATTAKADDDLPDDDDDRPDDDDPIGPFPATPVAPDEPIGPFPAVDVDDPTLVVNKYLCPTRPDCYDGSLYMIKSGDNPTEVAKAVLRNSVPADNVSELVAPYIGQMSIHSFNLALYSCIWQPKNPNEPSSYGRMGFAGKPPADVRQRYTAKEYDSQGTMRRWYIGDAFMSKKHKDNLVRMRGGNDPLRSTDNRGRKLESGNSFGLIWLPKILGFRPSPHAAIQIEPGLPPDLAALAPDIYG
jgi:hypothetical protein